jgi:hypothetical protein
MSTSVGSGSTACRRQHAHTHTHERNKKETYNCHGGGVHTTRAFGLWHALYAVHTHLVLEVAKHLLLAHVPISDLTRCCT